MISYAVFSQVLVQEKMQNEGGLCQVLSPNAASALPDSCLLDVLFKRPVRAVCIPPCSQRNKRRLVGLMKHLGC